MFCNDGFFHNYVCILMPFRAKNYFSNRHLGFVFLFLRHFHSSFLGYVPTKLHHVRNTLRNNMLV